jgi:hypothetical protein
VPKTGTNPQPWRSAVSASVTVNRIKVIPLAP